MMCGMSTATEAHTAPTTRWQRIAAALPIAVALVLIGAVWAAGAVWSFEEQTAFAKDARFHVPELLPLVLDGMAVAMAAVAYAASLDARPAVFARLGTALAVACSAASNVAWAWERSAGDVQTIALAGGVPVVANLAFEVLLSEIRRQVLRRRGQPGPVAIVYPRLVRLALAPWPTFVAWRRLVLAATDPAKAFGQQPPVGAAVADEADPGIQLCRQLQQQMATARQSLSPGIARVALADHTLAGWPATSTGPSPAVATVERAALPPVTAPVPSAAVPTKATTRRRSVVTVADHKAPTKPTRKATRKATTAGSEADRTAAAYAALVADLGRPPTGSELATRAGVSRSYANNWKRAKAPTTEEN